MRREPRTFGDGGGVSRRDHAVRAANDANAGEGGLSAIDKMLAENSRAGVGKVDHVGNLFRTMDTPSDLDWQSTRRETADNMGWVADEGIKLGLHRGVHDPYQASNDPRVSTTHNNAVEDDGGDETPPTYSAQEADGGLAGKRIDPFTNNFHYGNQTRNNLEAAAYQTNQGIPVRFGSWTAGQNISVTRSPGDDKTDSLGFVAKSLDPTPNPDDAAYYNQQLACVDANGETKMRAQRQRRTYDSF